MTPAEVVGIENCDPCQTIRVRAPNGLISVNLGDLQHVVDLHQELKTLRGRIETLISHYHVPPVGDSRPTSWAVMSDDVVRCLRGVLEGKP